MPNSQPGRETFKLLVGAYSLGCDVQAPLATFSTIEELEAAEVSDSIILLRGDLVKEQMMPKNFPFYNPDHHRRLVGFAGGETAAGRYCRHRSGPRPGGRGLPLPPNSRMVISISPLST